MMAVIFPVDHELATGQPRRAERGGGRGGGRQPGRADPVREHRPGARPRGRRGGAAADRRPRRPRVQVPPEHPGLLPQRPERLPALRGDRRGGPAGAVPHRPQRHRLRPAGRRRHPPEVLAADPRRRRRRRLPRAEDRARAPVVPVDRRGDLDRHAQAAGVHRPLRLVAEVLPAAARAVRQHAALAAGAVRLRLPDDRAGPLARRLRGRPRSATRSARSCSRRTRLGCWGSQLRLEDLAGARLRERLVAELERAGQLEAGDLRAAVLDDLVPVQAPRPARGRRSRGRARPSARPDARRPRPRARRGARRSRSRPRSSTRSRRR